MIAFTKLFSRTFPLSVPLWCIHLNCRGHHIATKDTFSDSAYPFHNPKPMHLPNKILFFAFILCFSLSPNLALHKHDIVYCKHCQLCDKLLMLLYQIKASVKCINVNRKCSQAHKLVSSFMHKADARNLSFCLLQLNCQTCKVSNL